MTTQFAYNTPCIQDDEDEIESESFNSDDEIADAEVFAILNKLESPVTFVIKGDESVVLDSITPDDYLRNYFNTDQFEKQFEFVQNQ